MPARKPFGLHTRHATKAEKAQREARESSVTPERELSVNAPARLKGHEVAAAAWRRIMRTYAELEGVIVTRLDQDLLVDYCILMEQLVEMDEMRKSSADIHKLILAKMARIETQRKEIAKSLRGASTEEASVLLAKDEELENQHLDLALRLSTAFDTILKLDSRVDLKRSKLHTLRQSLYLTPRARAGAAPKEKEVQAPPDEMEKLLNSAGIFVAGQDEGK